LLKISGQSADHDATVRGNAYLDHRPIHITSADNVFLPTSRSAAS